MLFKRVERKRKNNTRGQYLSRGTYLSMIRKNRRHVFVIDA